MRELAILGTQVAAFAFAWGVAWVLGGASGGVTFPEMCAFLAVALVVRLGFSKADR